MCASPSSSLRGEAAVATAVTERPSWSRWTTTPVNRDAAGDLTLQVRFTLCVLSIRITEAQCTKTAACSWRGRQCTRCQRVLVHASLCPDRVYFHEVGHLGSVRKHVTLLMIIHVRHFVPSVLFYLDALCRFHYSCAHS